ncbi:Mu transposase C-terminal domain-containing protein [Mucilaginibacter lappiensis]|uniref:Putative transposase n=1 Tax=Mucilaginibacter lappiensis TaxID=354630 RepID=A0A841JT69_9SPHI|nr:Mu transposase C-terminal domain-containing protein [Mucilaginibacter lappiensis]MBB6131475.1 putative transposase [Mucilaginibacter lappiensis]
MDGNISATKVAKTEHIPIRTIRHWLNQFSKKGLPGLERAKRSDRGNVRILNEEFQELTRGLALQKPPLSISAIYRKIVALSKRQDLKPPSYETIYGIIRKINPALLMLAHEGSKAYQQKYELIFRRECRTSNEIWQSDHTELDIYIIDANGKERKPWLTTIMDDYSRAIAGIFISLESPSAINTALALRQAIGKKEDPGWEICGIPQILYTDHGSDFMSHHIEQVCIALKIRMLNSMVGRPQGRGKIERFFQTLNECVLIDLPGFSIKGKPVSKPTLSLAQLEGAIMNFILNTYHVNNHSSTGQAPIKMWSAGFLPQMPESSAMLDLLLLTIHKPRKVQRDGIQFQGMRYIAPTLAGFVGELITIRYDPRDLAEIKVYYQESFLCKAVCQDIAEMVVSLKDIQTARNKIKNGLYLQIKKSQLLVKSIIQKKEAEKAAIEPGTPAIKKDPHKKSSLKLYDNE